MYSFVGGKFKINDLRKYNFERHSSGLSTKPTSFIVKDRLGGIYTE